MRQTAAALNRGWLIVIGLIVGLAGLAGALISTGAMRWIIQQLGVSLPLPGASAHFAGTGASKLLAATWLIVIIGVVGLILALLGLVWLIAQLPRTNEAKPFRLHDDARNGLTRCGPDVLSTAVERQVESLWGVQRASAVIRGTAEQPELSVKVTASDRTDVQQLIGQIETRVVGDLCRTLDTELHRFALQLEVVNASTRTHEITV